MHKRIIEQAKAAHYPYTRLLDAFKEAGSVSLKLEGEKNTGWVKPVSHQEELKSKPGGSYRWMCLFYFKGFS